MAEQDDDLELKKRARRRLVGAIAFALLAVALLPLVMDEEAPRIGGDIVIRIPETHEPRPLPLAAQPRSPAERSDAAALGGEAAERRSTAEQAPAIAGGRSEAEARAAAVDKPPTAGREAADGTRRESSVAVAKPAVESQSGQRDEARRAQAILEDKAERDEFVLLIGAYANQSNVTALTGKLAELEIPTYTESVTLPQGQRTRVRAGPFRSRDAALAAQEKMKRIGVNGQVAVRP